jgi:transglutaminase-like putative cysteine protease
LWRNDFVACTLLLVAGLAAQVAMWAASGRDAYLVAAPLLVAMTTAAAWQRTHELGRFARLSLQGGKFVSCAGLLAFFVGSGVIVLPQHTVGQSGPRPSMKAAVGAILVIAQLAQAATVTTRRDLGLAAPAICAMLVQAGMAAHDSAPAAAFVVSILAMVGGVALVFRGELLAESTVISISRQSLAILSLVSRVVAVAAVAFVLIPNSLQLSARPMAHRQPASPSAQSAGDQAAAPVLDPHSQAIADPAAGRLDLRVRGVLSDAPVFVVSADSPAYWQGAVYDHYDGAGWTMTGDSPHQSWAVDNGSTPPTQHAPADKEATGAGVESRTDAVQIVTTQVQHVVFAPGRATTYVGPGTVSSDGDGNARLDVGSNGPPSSRDYSVVSVKPNPSAPAADAASAADVRDPRWLQLPADLPDRVKSLSGQLIGHASSRAAAVQAVDDYLRRNAKYDLNAPVPAAGEDSVDDFLFVTHQGFCEQFASAAVVLLRAAGIPSRLVTGYSEGDLSSDPGRRVMRGADAHAWIQVWYPGVGWVDADPTATTTVGSPVDQPSTATAGPSSQSQPASGGSAALPSEPAAATPGASPTASPVPTAQASSEKTALNRAVASAPGGRFGVVALVVAFVAFAQLLVVVGRRRARRRRGAASQAERTGGPVLQAYLRLEEALTVAGRERVQGQTPREVVATIGAVGPAVASAVDFLERECFDVERLSAAEATRAVEVFTRLAERAAAADDKAAKTFH